MSIRSLLRTLFLGLMANFVFAVSAQAVVISLVGDKDGFGIPGAPAVPADLTTFTGIGGVFFTDYRSAADLAGAPFTDIWTSASGTSPVSYTHTYGVPAAATSATLFIQEAGMADARGPWDVSFNSTSIGSISFPVTSSDIRLLSFAVPVALLTGSDTVTLTYLDSLGEGYAINFSELVIDDTAVEASAPATIALLGLSLAALGVRRRHRV